MGTLLAKFLFDLLFAVLLIIQFPRVSSAVEPAVTIAFGSAESALLFLYRIKGVSKDQVESTLMHEDHTVETKRLDYPGGFPSLAGDLLAGFEECTRGSLADGTTNTGSEQMRDFSISFGVEPNTVALRSRGSLNGYGVFIRNSDKLAHVLSIISASEPKMYRLWQ